MVIEINKDNLRQTVMSQRKRKNGYRNQQGQSEANSDESAEEKEWLYFHDKNF